MEVSLDAKGPGQIPSQWFFWVTSHEILGKSEGFGVRAFFCQVTYLLTMGVGIEKSEILNKKMTPSLFEYKKMFFI